MKIKNQTKRESRVAKREGKGEGKNAKQKKR
jgi:hypothetical protein